MCLVSRRVMRFSVPHHRAVQALLSSRSGRLFIGVFHALRALCTRRFAASCFSWAAWCFLHTDKHEHVRCVSLHIASGVIIWTHDTTAILHRCPVAGRSTGRDGGFAVVGWRLMRWVAGHVAG